MNREAIIAAIRRERYVEIPSLQLKYGIPYGEIKAVVDEMVTKGELVYMGGIRYEYAYFKGSNGGKGAKGTTLDDFYSERKKRFANASEDLGVEFRDFFDAEHEADREDEIRKQALKLCISKNSASVSLLQRSLPIGYTKAGKIIDWMEEMGYISPMNGITPRKVLMSKKEFNLIYGAAYGFDENDDDYDENDDNGDPFEGLKEFEFDENKILEEDEEEPEEDTFDGVPAHPSWNSEFEFIRSVRQNIELIVISDKNMGVLGATKKAKALLWELKDRGDKKTAEVIERVVFEFEHTSPYEYSKLKKKYFV